MITPELALAKTFIDIFVTRDVFEAPSAARDVAAVLLEVDPEEAPHVADAYSVAVAAVVPDVSRWRSAADSAVQFDLFECLPTLLDGLEKYREPHQISNAAALLANPRSIRFDRNEVVKRLLDHPAAEGLGHLLRVRLGLEEPDTDLAIVLDSQTWPGKYGADVLARVAPIIYVGEEGAPPADLWRVLAALVDSGARVRRVSAATTNLEQPAWASEAYPFVFWSGNAVAHWRRLTGFASVKAVPVPPDLESRLALPRFLSDVRHQLPTGSEMAVPSEEPHGSGPAFSPETLTDGAFDSLEMMYLGAAGRSVLRSLSRDVLKPMEADVHRWMFQQLVTLRILQGFKARGAFFRADPGKLLNRLQDIAAASESKQVALDANGIVYVNDGGQFQTLSGQEVIEDVLIVDDAFRPFKLGGGMVPDLFRPGQRTAVHPQVLGGTPSIRDRRISARALVAVANERGMNVLRSAFPELEPNEIADGIRVGRAIIANREVTR